MLVFILSIHSYSAVWKTISQYRRAEMDHMFSTETFPVEYINL